MNEQEISAATQELELLRMQLDNLQKQEELIGLTHEEYQRARDALEELKGKKKGDKILVPIGANCWVHATLDNTKKGIASVGSNIAVGQKVEDIIERLDRQLAEISKAEAELSQRITKVEARARDLAAMLQDVYEKAEQEQGHKH